MISSAVANRQALDAPHILHRALHHDYLRPLKRSTPSLTCATPGKTFRALEGLPRLQNRGQWHGFWQDGSQPLRGPGSPAFDSSNTLIKLVGKHLRDDAKGIPQMAYIGCIVTQSPRAESVQEVCDQLVAAAKHIDKQRIGSTDDCGCSPFSIDKKPNHGSPDYARDIAFQKIANRVAGTKMAAEKLGVH